jgi:hypothetical protein
MHDYTQTNTGSITERLVSADFEIIDASSMDGRDQSRQRSHRAATPELVTFFKVRQDDIFTLLHCSR